MGAEVAVRSGAGTIVLDIRRGDGPKPALTYTFPALVTRTELVDRQPEKAAACIRGLIKAQNILKADPDRATEVGRKVFPEMEASLIAELIRRDIPYYSPAVPKPVVDDLQRFAVDMGLLKQPAPYEDVVATQFSDLWA
ncbi:MAG: ABC transporter substrate-binding protein [Chloroflexi bacterium]|nr:ABC transporter substrate-binding protein [Chloroflexota bacterium]